MLIYISALTSTRVIVHQKQEHVINITTTTAMLTITLLPLRVVLHRQRHRRRPREQEQDSSSSSPRNFDSPFILYLGRAARPQSEARGRRACGRQGNDQVGKENIPHRNGYGKTRQVLLH